MSVRTALLSSFVLVSAAIAAAAGLAQTTNAGSSSQSDMGAPIPVIVVEPSDDGIVIIGRVIALSEVSYTASMSIDRQGRSGSMKTRQGSEGALATGESSDVARVGLSMDLEAALNVELTVEVGGETVATSRLSLN